MTSPETFLPSPRLPRWLGARRLLVLSWAIVALVGVVQRWLQRAFDGVRNDTWAVAVDVWLIALWAGATPWIVRSARRFPLRGDRTLRHGAHHLGIAAAFVVSTNVLIRLPMLLHDSPGSVVIDTVDGLVRFGPTAFLAYALIVAIAQWTAHAAPVPQAPPSWPERIAVREWNRVRLVRPVDIVWIEADDNYVVVHAAGRTFKGRGRISELARQLDPAVFARIHRSAVVRLASVREVQALNKGDLAVVLDGGKVLRVARSRRAMLEAALQASLGARL